MIYYKGSSNGSGSSDPDRNEGKKNGDVCEYNVDNVNVESCNVVNHVGKLLHSNPMYTSCHVFSHHEIGIKGEEDNKFTDFSPFFSLASNLSMKKKRTMTNICGHLRQ